MKKLFSKKVLIIFLIIVLIVSSLALLETSRIKIDLCGNKFTSYDLPDLYNTDIYLKGDLFEDNNQYVIFGKTSSPIKSDLSSADLNICIGMKDTKNNWILVANFDTETTVINNKLDYKIEDINFDGVKDLMILNSIGYSGVNNFYDLYIKTNNKFQYIDNFKDLSNPVISNADKTISSTIKTSANTSTEDTYKWDGLTLKLVGSTDIQLDLDSARNVVITTEKVYSVNSAGVRTFVKKNVTERPNQ